MPEGEEEKIKVQFLNGREEEFLNAKKLKDYMCHNGYSHIIVNEKTAGLNDDIDKVISHKDPNDTICLIKTAAAIGEGIIYLNNHLNDEQKGRIREQFNDKELEDITELNLNNLDLKALPESFGGLTALKVLELAKNQLTSLPKSIGGLKDLRGLSLGGNELSSLPESIGGLKSLTDLALGNNKLISLPESFGGLAALKRLNLNNNQLPFLPESIENLNTLEGLFLGNNQLTSLPESIGGLKSLTSLDLDRNKLTSLPESIGGLTNLWALVLSNNQLKALPESFADLKSLEMLLLSDIKLIHIPNVVRDLDVVQKNFNIDGGSRLIEPTESLEKSDKPQASPTNGPSGFGIFSCCTEVPKDTKISL